MLHELKTWPEEFKAIEEGRKTFEVRKNDRGFKVGDILRLRAWSPDMKAYLGLSSYWYVGYILQGEFGLPPDICVMQLTKTLQPGEREEGA